MEKLAIKNTTFVVSILLLVHLVFLVSLQFTAWPEMLAWPYLISEGWVPYKDIAIAHTPLLLYLLSIIYKIFGVGVIQLKIFTWIIILLTDLLVYFVTKKLWSNKIALLSLAIYIPLQILYQGNGLWFDLLLAPLFLSVFYFIKQKKFIAAGVIFAVAFLTKQTSAWMLFPIAFSLFINDKRNLMELEKRYVPLAFGFVVVFLIFAVLMYAGGILGHFAYWGIEFGIFTLPSLQGQIDLPSLKEMIVAFAPFAPMALLPWLYKKDVSIEILVWIIFASLGTYPRWELFHFQPALPFVAIGIALVINKLFRRKPTFVYIFVFALFALFVRYLFNSFNNETRFYEPSVQQIVEIVDEHSGTEDFIYVANYWDSIYALVDNKPSTKPLIPYIPWYLNHNNLSDVIATDIKSDLPKVIVRGQYSDSGLGSYKISGLEDIIIRYYTLHTTIQNVDIFIRN